MDLNYDNDWHRYFGDSTIHTVGRHGYVVHLPDSGVADQTHHKPDGSEGKDSGRLEQDNAGDSD